MITNAGADEKVYSVAKLAMVLDTLAAEGAPIEKALNALHLTKAAISSPETRVSLNQVLDGYRYAAELSRDSHFGYTSGQRLHVSAYGMYGFAILSSMNYRQTMQFAMQYHQLATPLAEIRFSEQDGCGIWRVRPISNPRVDARLYKFIVELQFGIILSLHRDVMGHSFGAREFHATYAAPDDAADYSGCSGPRCRSARPATT